MQGTNHLIESLFYFHNKKGNYHYITWCNIITCLKFKEKLVIRKLFFKPVKHFHVTHHTRHIQHHWCSCIITRKKQVMFWSQSLWCCLKLPQIESQYSTNVTQFDNYCLTSKTWWSTGSENSRREAMKRLKNYLATFSKQNKLLVHNTDSKLFQVLLTIRFNM